MGRGHDDLVNSELIPLPIAWVKTWTGNIGLPARVFHVTMGSAQDYENAGLRRLSVNAAYWCMQMEGHIDANSCVDIVGPYNPPDSGFDYAKLKVSPNPPSYFK